MKVPKITSIILVALTSLSVLNFLLKYYTYFVLMVSSKKTAHDVNNIAEETGEIPHPHELYVPLLTFIPTKSPVLTRPWVLITSSFIEENFIGLTMSFMTIFYLGRYLENIWGLKEFGKFICCNILIGNLALYVYFLVLVLFRDLSDVPPVVVTPMAVIMGFFVALKQRIPSHYFLFFKGNVRIKVKYLPFLLMTGSFLLQMISEEFRISFLLAVNGFIISWIYLRYFKDGTNERQSYLLPFSLSRKRSQKKNYKKIETENSNNSIHLESVIIKGDRSEQFSLHTFFPTPISLIVKAFTDVVFNILVKYKIVDPKNYLMEDIEDDPYAFDEMQGLQNNLFDLSSLNGAEDVPTIPNASSKLKEFYSWIAGSKVVKSVGIKTSMDKRRKQALKEFE